MTALPSYMCNGSAAVRVTHADNQLVIFLNGVAVYNKRTEGDPALNDVVELTTQLTSGVNTLTIIGVDWGGRANFEGTVTIGNDNIPFAYRVEGTPASNGMPWFTSFRILKY